MKKVLLCIFAFYCFVHTMKGQYTVSGLVTDSLSSEAVIGCILQVKALGEETTHAFAITDAEGKYKLSVTLDSAYIFARILGYEEKKVFLKGAQNIDFQLIEQEYNLAEIQVKAYKSGFTHKGDTLEYKTEVFTNGYEKNLKDVLSRLPGVDVSENGSITANGKTIDQFRLADDDFMNGNRNTALLGIDADMVGNVQLHTDKGEMGQEISVLDVGIKAEYRQVWKGKAQVAGNFEKRYNTGFDFYHIGLRTKIFISAKAADINPSPLGLNDYFQMNGGPVNFLRSVIQKKTVVPAVFLSTDNNKKQAHFLPSFNFSHQINSKSNISGYVLSNRSTAQRVSKRLNLQSEQFFLENDNTEALSNTDFFSNFQYKINLNKKWRLQWTTLFNYSAEKNAIDNLSRINDNSFTQSIFKKSTDYQAFTDVMLNGLLWKKHLFTANAGYRKIDFFEKNDLLSNQIIPWTLNIGGQSSSIAAFENAHQSTAFYVRGNLLVEWKKRKWTSEAELIQDNTVGRSRLETTFPYHRTVSQALWANSLSQTIGQWKFSGGIHAAYYNISANEQQRSERLFVLPEANIAYNFYGSFRSVTLSYKVKRNLSPLNIGNDTPYFENATVLNSKAIRPDDFERFGGITFHYSDINALENRLFFLFFNYSDAADIGGTNTFFRESYREIQQVINPKKGLTGGLKYDKKLSAWQSSFSLTMTYSYSGRSHLLENIAVAQSVSNADARLHYHTLFKKGINWELDLKYRLLYYAFGGIVQQNSIYTPQIKAVYHKEKFKADFSYEFFLSKLGQQSIRRDYLNASAAFKIAAKVEVYFKGYHLLQLKEDRQELISKDAINQYNLVQYFNFPGYIIGGVRWNFALKK